MILTLICWLLDRYVLPAGTLAKIRSAAEVLFQGMYKKALLFTVFILLSLVTKAQDQTLEYDVTHKGEHVGSMKLHQKKFGDNISINIESAVSMRFVFNINVFTEEASIFKNGRLVYSRVYRNVNGKENSNKQTTA